MLEDRRLLNDLRAKNPDALRRIYQKYKDRMLTVAASILSDTHAAEDCLQDVFVRFAATGGNGVNKNLKGYLISCIINRARDQLRKGKNQPDTELYEPDCPMEETGQPLMMIENEQKSIILNTLTKLPLKQRQVITLHLHAQMTFKQIAAMLDESTNTIQSRYRYGIKKLRSLLEKRSEK